MLKFTVCLYIYCIFLYFVSKFKFCLFYGLLQFFKILSLVQHCWVIHNFWFAADWHRIFCYWERRSHWRNKWTKHFQKLLLTFSTALTGICSHLPEDGSTASNFFPSSVICVSLMTSPTKLNMFIYKIVL